MEHGTWNTIKATVVLVKSNVCARNTYENRNKVICFHGKFDPKLLRCALLQFQKQEKI